MLRTASSVVVLFSLVFAGFFVLEGCGVDPLFVPCGSDAQCGDGHQCRNAECWPACSADKPCPQVDVLGNPFPTVCYQGFCHMPSEIPDAGTDGDAGKTSAICGDSCVSIPDGWSGMQALWIGPVESAPFYATFQDEKTLPRFIGRADLTASPAECDVCSCSESSGTCIDLPSSIEIHASMCRQTGASLPFDGPANWDGKCTNANSIPADQKCPTGSTTLCAQSVTVEPLGAPVDESCTPFADKPPVANVRLSGPAWKTAAIGYDVPGCNTNESCLPSIELPKGFRSCIYQRGEHECPSTWSGDRHLVYETNADKRGYIDGRNCSPCSCGTPVGSACTAQFRVFEDAACTKQILADPVSSLGEQCTNVFPAGRSIGSKEIPEIAYLPGVCEPSGGEPIGEVKPDPDQAVTFCCSAQSA